MPQLRLIADIHISPQTVTALQQEGYDIVRVSQVLASKTADIDILNFARQDNRVVLTQDLDFSLLVALSGHNQPSLITLRLTSASPALVTQKLLESLPQVIDKLLEGYAVVITDKAIRLRKLPIR